MNYGAIAGFCAVVAAGTIYLVREHIIYENQKKIFIAAIDAIYKALNSS